MPVLFDHLTVLGFAVAYPLYELARTRSLRARIEAGDTAVRSRDYLQSTLWLWGFTLVVLVLHFGLDRPPAALGLGVSAGWGFALAAALALALSVFLQLQPWWIGANETARQRVGEQLRRIEWYLPHDRSELRLFLLLSVTAGICEEILYRGYLIAYLASVSSMSVAVVVSTLLFGAAHFYLGVGAAVRATLAGAALAALYLLGGSLWPAILLHASIDVGSGRTAHLLLGRAEGADGPSR